MGAAAEGRQPSGAMVEAPAQGQWWTQPGHGCPGGSFLLQGCPGAQPPWVQGVLCGGSPKTRHWTHPLVAAALVQFRTSVFGFFSPWVLFKHGKNHVTIRVFSPHILKGLFSSRKLVGLSLISHSDGLFSLTLMCIQRFAKFSF